MFKNQKDLMHSHCYQAIWHIKKRMDADKLFKDVWNILSQSEYSEMKKYI
jgi:hypothetical protein